MKVEVKKLPKSEVSITIEVDPEMLGQFRTQAAARISEKVKIPGFRGGKAPAYVVESEVGKEQFFQEVLRIALPMAYLKAVEQEKLPVASRPKVDILSESPLKFEAKAALLPEVIVKGYEKVKVPKEEIKIDDKEVEDVVTEMRKYRASYNKREGKTAEKGDRIEIDFEGFDNKGVVLENTSSKNHPLIVGENTLVPGFEENLVGMKEGENKEFGVTFPKDYQHRPFQNKKVKFKVSVKGVEEVTLPHFDETFVEQVLGEKKSVDEFKKIIGDDLKARKDREARAQRENILMEKWLKLAKMDVPHLLIEEEVDYLIDEMKRGIESRGIPWEKYEEHLKSQKKDLRADKMEEAIKRIKIRLIINHLFKLEGIEVSEVETDAEVTRILGQYPPQQSDKLRKQLAKGQSSYTQLRNQMMLDKLFAKFLS